MQVSGLSVNGSQRASDLSYKCRYMDEKTGGRGIVFATGTPVSNSMTELFTMQRYLQRFTLEKAGLACFDLWASTFGETVTGFELAPEGSGYNMKTRFSRFHNVPELMNLFKEIADIKTADTLNLDRPEAVLHNVIVEMSEQQKELMADLSARATKIRNGGVDPSKDNMLRITNDGRAIGFDQRMLDPALPDNPNSKISACVENVAKIWAQTKDRKSTQLIFSDLGTPKKGSKNSHIFDAYADMRAKLISKGIPAKEIAFIHDADTDQKKKALFQKVRAGTVRVLIGSTQKMGTGMNVQDKLIALHDLDIPYRPSDLKSASALVRGRR